MIDLEKLPKEIRDRLELKADTDPTFYRALEEDYTDIFFETLASRADVDVEHSYICSVTGSQGCFVGETNLFISRNNLYGFVPIKDVRVGDKVLSVKNGKLVFRKVLRKFHYKDVNFFNIQFKRCKEKFGVTSEHRFFTIENKKIRKITVGQVGKKKQLLLFSNGGFDLKKKNEKSYAKGILVGAYIADGNGGTHITKHDSDVVAFLLKMGGYAGLKVNAIKEGVGISRKENFKLFGDKSRKYLKGFFSLDFLKGVVDGYIIRGSGFNCNGRKLEVEFVGKCKEWMEQFGFLLWFFYGIKSICGKRVLKSGRWKGNVYYSRVLLADDARKFLSFFWWLPGKKSKVRELLRKSSPQKDARFCYGKLPFDGVDTTGCFKGKNSLRRQIANSINRCRRLGYIQRRSIGVWCKKDAFFYNKFKEYFKFFEHFWSDEFVILGKGVGDVYDIEVEETHNYVLSNGLVSSNSGKSFSSITACAILDPNFSADRIYFDYNQLVYDRKKLKPHSAVLVDEQTESYGVDSHRVNIILTALKEQLRKRSIHFFFCSPVLKEEYRSSHYVIETMFIDYEKEEVYCAYKTRELHTLGYIRIPHPKKFVSKELLKAYEEKKEAHLDRLTGAKQVDEMEERAKKIMDSPLFKKAEILYKKKLGYIPISMLFQIINKLYPEFKSSVIVGELASRIKFNKEVSGEWIISGARKKAK